MILFAAAIMSMAMVAPDPARAAQDGPSVYIFPGGAFGVFSSGLEQLEDDFASAGIEAEVVPLRGWRDVAATVIMRHTMEDDPPPVVLIGHSWGSNAALLMAAELQKASVPVDLIVTYDPLDDIQISANVSRTINFYIGGNGVVLRRQSEHTALDNIDTTGFFPNVSHTNIDDNRDLHRRTLLATMDAIAMAADSTPDG